MGTLHHTISDSQKAKIARSGSRGDLDRTGLDQSPIPEREQEMYLSNCFYDSKSHSN